jgi:hypothetical protein
MDVFGWGIRDIGDKWEAIAEYKYHIVIENCVYPDYWTEKLSDTYLGGDYPIYSGCPNLSRYFNPDAFTAIDISNVEESIEKIENCIKNDLYENSRLAIQEAKNKVLNQYNLFAIIHNLIHSKGNRALARRKQKIKMVSEWKLRT